MLIPRALPAQKMFPRMLSRYCGVLARETRIACLPGVTSPSFVAISQRRSLHTPKSIPAAASAKFERWCDQRRMSSYGAFKPVSTQESRGRPWKARQPPSERLYVGNLTDANRREVVAFVNTLPGLVDVFDRMMHSSHFFMAQKH